MPIAGDGSMELQRHVSVRRETRRQKDRSTGSFVGQPGNSLNMVVAARKAGKHAAGQQTKHGIVAARKAGKQATGQGPDHVAARKAGSGSQERAGKWQLADRQAGSMQPDNGLDNGHGTVNSKQ